MNSTCDQVFRPVPVKIPAEPRLSPQEHLDLLHPPTWLGRIAVGPLKATGPCLNRHAALQAAAGFSGAQDVYISQQGFFGRRSTDKLANLGCCYVDLDYHKEPRLAGLRPAFVTQEVLGWLDEQRLPRPSYVMFSGRGLARRLAARLPPETGAAALAGCSTTAAGKFAAARGRSQCLRRGSGVPPRGNLQQQVRRDGPAAAGQKDPLRPAGPRRDPNTYWHKVLEELDRLVAHRWPDGIPAGSRDAVMFIVGCALAWTEPEPQLFSACRKRAETWTPWSASELRQRLSAVLDRAARAAAGAKTSSAGRAVDPRYWRRAATTVASLRITPDEMRQLKLRVLCSPDIKRDRKRQRAQDQRKAEGRVARHVYTAAAAARRIEIPKLRGDGLSWRQIGHALGISESEVRRLDKQNPHGPASLPIIALPAHAGCAGSVPVYGGLPTGGIMRSTDKAGTASINAGVAHQLRSVWAAVAARLFPGRYPPIWARNPSARARAHPAPLLPAPAVG